MFEQFAWIDIDWTTLGTSAGSILLAAAGIIGAWNKWFKDRGEGEQTATKMTLDGALALARLLQEERTALQTERKALVGEITEISRRFDEYRERSERRISALELEVWELKKLQRPNNAS